MSRGFLGDEKVIQSANTRNCGRVFLFETTENEDGNDKFWVEVIIVTFFRCSSHRSCPQSKQ